MESDITIASEYTTADQVEYRVALTVRGGSGVPTAEDLAALAPRLAAALQAYLQAEHDDGAAKVAKATEVARARGLAVRK